MGSTRKTTSMKQDSVPAQDDPAVSHSTVPVGAKVARVGSVTSAKVKAVLATSAGRSSRRRRG